MRVSKREALVLSLLVQGLTNKEICSLLGRHPQTIEDQRKALMTRLGCRTAVQLGYKAAKENLC